MKKRNNQNTPHTKAVLYGFGTLGRDDRKRFLDEIEKLPKKVRKDVREANDIIALISLAASEKRIIRPTAGLKKKILREADESLKKDSGIKEKDFEFVFADSKQWMDHPFIKGISIKQLAFNKKKDYVMILMKVAAETEYPAHHHSGAEECYVLEGDLHAQGKILGPGDFHHAEGGSNHSRLFTKKGCTLLLVIDPKDY